MSKPTFNRALRRSALTVALGICFASGVHAQSNTTGNIIGQATAGDTIVVENPSTGFSREIAVGSDGTYRAGSLPPGSYKVTQRRADGTTAVRDNITVSVGTGSSVNFVRAGGAVELDRVEVVGTFISPIDVSSVESATIVTAATIQRLPIPRNVTSVALLAPGTTQGDSAFGNLASFGGATVGENAYYINGFNVTNFRNGLGFSNVPFDMYSEYQVKTGGYGAEFGRSTGGVVNATTKRGSNEWHWGGSMYWQPNRWRKANPDVVDTNGDLFNSNQNDTVDRLESNMYLSGPLIKDRLFFYAIASGRDNTTSVFSPTGAVTDSSNTSPFYGLKLDAYITDNHRLEYTGFRDTSEIVSPGRRLQPTPLESNTFYSGATATAEEAGGDNHIVKYTGYLTDSFTLSALWGQGEYSLSGPYNTGPSAGDCIWFSYDTLARVNRNVGCAVQSLDVLGSDKRTAYRVDAEWDLGDVFLGSHFLRFGYDLEDNESLNQAVIPGPTGFRYLGSEVIDRNGTPTDTSDDFTRWQVRRDTYANVGEFQTESRAFYIEDQWKPTDNLLLSLGLRNEQFDNKNANGESFITIKDQWAPRLGFSWDVGGEGKMKLFGNYGRYHLPVATNTNVRLAGAELYLQDLYNWDGVTFGAFGEPVLGTLIRSRVLADGTVHPTVSSVDQDIDAMYQDEAIIGFEYQIAPKWSVGVRGIARDLKSTLEDMAVDAGLNRYIVDNGIAPSVDCDDDGVNESVGCGFDYYVLGNPGAAITLQVDIDGDGDLDPVELSPQQLGYDTSVRKYKAVELFFARAWDNQWFLQGSYTYSKSYGNNEGFVRSDNGQDDAGLTTLFDQPGLGDGSYGRLPNDRPHTLKVWGAWQFAPEWLVSGNLLVQSGRPINCFGNHPTDDFAAAYGTESFYCDGVLVPRGSRGRTPTFKSLDLGLEYRPLWAAEKVWFKIDATNVLGEQEYTEVYEV
ncbi:MAG TPA: TonB-dependent receptor, partial [Lysobacter sp.]